MLPTKHAVISLPLGLAVGFFTRSVLAGLLCFSSGVLIDVDHLVDYLIHNGLKTLNPKEIYHTCGKMAKPEIEGGTKRLFIIFHGIEIAVLFWIGYALSKNIYLLSVALGYTGHLTADIFGNPEIKPSSYFIIWRFVKRFKTTRLVLKP